jgi:hypothetical protein
VGFTDNTVALVPKSDDGWLINDWADLYEILPGFLLLTNQKSYMLTGHNRSKMTKLLQAFIKVHDKQQVT